jgi:signal transduction histidine kinase/small ligand-binding sensory domain FIST
MQTFNIRFRSDEKLKDYIYENQIIDSKDILIQVFSHQKKHNEIQKITLLLNELLPSASVIGTTTDGEVIEGRILTLNIIISITVFDYSSLKSAFLEPQPDSYRTGVTLAKEVIQKDTKALILFVSADDIDASEILKGIKSVKQDLIISGGLCGDGGKFDGGSVFNGTQISKNGIVAVSLNGDRLTASNRYTSEWEPVGRSFKITKSKNNRIFTVDKMSVYDLYEKYLGSEIATKLPLSGLQFPFVFKDSTNGSYIARSVRSNPGDGSLTFATKMDEQQSLHIAFGNAEKMFQNTQNIIKDIAQNEPVETLFIYASGGRRRFLQNIAHAEIEPYKMLGTNCGYYGYGEFFANEEKSLFLNQSMTVLTLSESNKKVQKELHFKTHYKKLDMNLEITRALTNIAKVSSQELQDLNQKLELRVKEEVKKSRDKDSIMIHNSKLAQMGEMMSMIAHQWRQPLSAITAASTGLQVKIELGKYDEQLFLNSLEKIEEYVHHLSNTIDDFTGFFKPSKRKEKTTLKKLTEKALFILSSSFVKHSIEVTTNYDKETTLSTYSNEVIQVLINLLKNGENILLVRKIKEPKIEINCFEKEQKKYIEIIDNAGGIDEAIIDKIFESYFTTKESEDSTGLGLYMSKFIIEDSCKGKLKVENVNEGAKFTIMLD